MRENVSITFNQSQILHANSNVFGKHGGTLPQNEAVSTVALNLKMRCYIAVSFYLGLDYI